MMNKQLQSMSPQLSNADLAPEIDQQWSWYSIFAFWMSDVHSVGGYVFAASLFALGLAGWQVFVCLLAGIMIVYLFANLMGTPGQKAGVPFPVVCRLAFGVKGANIPAIIRGCIAVVWYGIQTYLASSSFIILALYFFPSLKTLQSESFVGLSYLGWMGFLFMWIAQALVFMFGMPMIRKVIDYSGPAIYIAMFALCGFMLYQTGWSAIHFNLSSKSLVGWNNVKEMIIAIALVAGYFAGPTLNFSDFARYCKNKKQMKVGNLLGLPLNFIVFSIFSVLIVSASIPMFGQMITDPIKTVQMLDSATITVLGALTFILATIGINIVANFVSPAFDFSNIAPQKISFKWGGFIAAIASLLMTPWNLFNNPDMIHYTVDLLAALIGPLYGIVLVDYYRIRKQKIHLSSLYNDTKNGQYWYNNGWNTRAIIALIIAGCASILSSFVFTELANFSLFISGAVAGVSYHWLMAKSTVSIEVVEAQTNL
ncbi:NCS1 family nucleobase:cation symporter-1 [Celerinatantimonas sp. MCCC 1A17872]|uniref:NCS1 family nucleobase:cation symporter-1 n=1 Tax=Celerinatantimonas sp. MCCC 1A17872 TaxID=3177514 RepID=UPI0038CC0EE9